MLNLRYYDVHTGTIKYARHDSKDEAQYGDPPDQRTPASQHLLEIFTDSPHEEIGSNLKLDSTISLDIQDGQKSTTTEQILDEILELSPNAYTNAAAATIKMKVNRAIFQRPDISHLKEELQSFDVSTNRYYYTQSETIPLQSAHAKLGLQVKLHPDIKHAI